MAKELTERQKLVRAKARKAATAAGKQWATMPKEERRNFLKQARTGPESGAAKLASPARDQAKKAAAAAGKNWRDLSQEERRSYISAARKKT
jgi:acyl-CoA reductase-like NAD-dependent aldehyde dehydrogenase